MLRRLLVVALWGLAAGCAPVLEGGHAPDIDREWGKAQASVWDRQVAFPDAPRAGALPEGMEGVTSEEVMDAYNKTFADRPAPAPVIEIGLGGGGAQ